MINPEQPDRRITIPGKLADQELTDRKLWQRMSRMQRQRSAEQMIVFTAGDFDAVPSPVFVPSHTGWRVTRIIVAAISP